MASNEDTPDTTASNVDKSSNSPNEGYEKKCIFCKIVHKETATELVHAVSG